MCIQDYALLASVIVAAEGATFEGRGALRCGRCAGVTESLPRGVYRAGAGRAEAFLLNPQPLAGAYRARMGRGCRSCAER